MPDAARQETEEGLIAFAEHWYDLVNYTYESGNGEPLRAISGPRCTAANFVLDQVETGYQGDDWMAGADIDLNFTWSEYTKNEYGYFTVYADMMQDDIKFYSPEAGLLGTNAGSEYPFIQAMVAKFTEQGWLAEDVITLDVPFEGPPGVTFD